VQSIGTLVRCATASVGLTLACATFLAADRMSKTWIFDLALGDFTWSGRQCDQRHACVPRWATDPKWNLAGAPAAVAMQLSRTV